jgi:hypothetical protein
MTTLPVTVKCYRIDWLHDNDKILYQLLSSYNEIEIFEDQFISDFIESQSLTMQLFCKAMLPYMV